MVTGLKRTSTAAPLCEDHIIRSREALNCCPYLAAQQADRHGIIVCHQKYYNVAFAFFIIIVIECAGLQASRVLNVCSEPTAKYYVFLSQPKFPNDITLFQTALLRSFHQQLQLICHTLQQS